MNESTLVSFIYSHKVKNCNLDIELERFATIAPEISFWDYFYYGFSFLFFVFSLNLLLPYLVVAFYHLVVTPNFSFLRYHHSFMKSLQNFWFSCYHVSFWRNYHLILNCLSLFFNLCVSFITDFLVYWVLLFHYYNSTPSFAFLFSFTFDQNMLYLFHSLSFR